MRYIVCLLHNLDDLPFGGQGFYECIPGLEFESIDPMSRFSSTPQLLCSHLTFDLLKDHVINQKVKMIHIRRDPRDILVSYYYFYKITNSMGPYKGTWNDFYELFVQNELLYGDVIEHVNGWCKQIHHDNILYITYEEMKNNLKEIIGKVAMFCNIKVTKEQIDYVADNSSFQKMRSNYNVNGVRLAEMGMFDFEKGQFLRKGVSGDWKEHFNDKQIQHMDRRLKEQQHSFSSYC